MFERNRKKGSLEALQFVRYLNNQEYQPHFDFSNVAEDKMRFSTLLLYLQNADSGGGTSFPLANDGHGIQVLPPPGSGVMFYSQGPDGNGDLKSLHSGMQVTKGTKLLCNLWAWS